MKMPACIHENLLQNMWQKVFKLPEKQYFEIAFIYAARHGTVAANRKYSRYLPEGFEYKRKWNKNVNTNACRVMLYIVRT